MRITNKRIRQFLLTTGDPIDPDTLPDTVQLYAEDGTPFNLPAVMALNTARRVLTITTAALTAAANTGLLSTRRRGGGESGAVDIAVAAVLLRIAVDRPCRVRFYTTAAKRDADLLRDRYTDPRDVGGRGMNEDHGCLSEFLLLTTLAMDNIPPDYLYSEVPGASTIYYRIDNYDLAAGPVNVTLTVKDIEH